MSRAKYDAYADADSLQTSEVQCRLLATNLIVNDSFAHILAILRLPYDTYKLYTTR